MLIERDFEFGLFQGRITVVAYMSAIWCRCARPRFDAFFRVVDAGALLS